MSDINNVIMQPKGTPGDYWLKREWSALDRLKAILHMKKISPELLETLKKVAWELAQLFPYYVLARSTMKSTKHNQGNEVHAYIFLHYPLIYRKLIFDYRVIDLACLYARRNFIPAIISRIPLEDLKKFRASLMFIEPYTLKNFPLVTFNKIVVYTEKEFYDSVAREIDAEINWKGWDTKGIKLTFSSATLAFVSFDIPMWIVTHTPGKHSLYYEADFDDIEKQHAKEVILTKAYHQAQVDLAKTGKILDKTKLIAESYGRMLSDSLKEAERQRVKDFRAQIEHTDRIKEEERQRLTQKPSKIKQFMPLIAILLIIIGAIIILYMVITLTARNVNPPESASLFLNFSQLFMQVMS